MKREINYCNYFEIKVENNKKKKEEDEIVAKINKN